MKQPIRLFGIGLLTAGIIMLGVYFFTNGNIQTADNLSDEELVTLVEDKGYHVLTNSEYIAVSVDEVEDEVEDEATAAKNEQQPDTKAKSAEDKSDNNEDKQENQNADKEDKNKAKQNDDKKQAADKEKNKEDEKKTFTVNIKEGMPSSEISDQLEANDIIDDAAKFNAYLEDNDYSQKVQLGKFKVSSDMSLKEIAEAITK
ncbi:endolytic transglycosylase MltG [Virgibacillus pantothenticus]|uniref:endolytic transglycosylase MltG n=1 Tax=Virgibacillus pantothenticus TaxID=1473 RepID=UPI00067CEA95|nr:endolytic transglycosylase MltG [Virgibacillus pantothenticus]MED3737975.1 endolytic transglycosylase MltG [Virgibacillus pantothenticus]QTY17743.1 endolytic transglycosylase MltG [Virgibacillus pantothenticus]SIS51049.1 YceG-like family protein [Virgibacillus pantothenticus]